ncbi:MULTISPECIES: type II toxin-antitoxin system Phd/YefM family antitoxin [Agrobacterium]|uniref:type II toxin-antitoxin system Phd/YefM family antitoxin n=1 Tax=Agrobacterium TaxID=357 RepID=UPI0015741AC2|nr:type II toxin-antitoxin system prevent-host-death family antitoxin [Agrobacterium tumefaciens]WCJ61561.1 type II toxin-antitoxin system prevent-host-death family antitoxin [Agrobacterium tumefaciens]
MANVRFTEFRQNFATHFDRVLETRAPLLVTRQGKEAVVVLAEGEYESMQETLHLLSNPANASRLRVSMGELERGDTIERDPTEE